MDPNHPRKSITREEVLDLADDRKEEAEDRVDTLLEEEKEDD